MDSSSRELTLEQLTIRLTEVEQELATLRAAPRYKPFHKRAGPRLVSLITTVFILIVALSTGVLASSMPATPQTVLTFYACCHQLHRHNPDRQFNDGLWERQA